jgi:hypothetical protein
LRDVVEVRATGPYRDFLRFEDGVYGEVDLSTLIAFEGVLAPLRDSPVSPNCVWAFPHRRRISGVTGVLRRFRACPPAGGGIMS